ncbi:ABC transporter ATP-binding protein [Actinoallomurus sp. NPDC050550]|uniref:ABC transporter ATP-binding protein n=1 Tax=Actinoallomurus sp. NPDC050550 TaxID=3154937 RepID=UPI003410FF5F
MLCLIINTSAFAFISLALRTTVDATVRGDHTRMALAAVCAAVAYALDAVVARTGFNLRMRLVEMVGMRDIEPRVLGFATDIDGLEHLERSDYLDRVTVLRGQAWAVVDSAWGALEGLAHAIRLILTLGLLASVSPLLLGLLVFAVIPLWFDGRGRARVRAAELDAAEPTRLQRHLFELCTEPESGQEIRVAGVEADLLRSQAEAWDRALRGRVRASMMAAAYTVAGWSVFTCGFGVGLAVITRLVMDGRGTLGDVVFVVTVASQLYLSVQETVRRTGETSGYARLLDPYLWLRDFHTRSHADSSSAAFPDKLRTGISFEHVTFRYPGRTDPSIEDFTAHLPAGSVVALVGEYGSGKTTLIKLLAGFYRPDSGRITVDGVDLSALDVAAWRNTMSAVFQDFGRYRTTIREAIGLGSLAHIDDDEEIAQAVRDAGLEPVLSRLPYRLDTPLGAAFGGTELSEGQWQKTALARGCMRSRTLVSVLDEPTASLDAPSEKAIFERHLARARTVASTTGGVTIIVSHRFSTVVDADLILVMDQGRLIEAGDHHALLAHDGHYAELYELHSQAYTDPPCSGNVPASIHLAKGTA